jgi:uncharacterized Zn-binding protein involved in type VI secretion
MALVSTQVDVSEPHPDCGCPARAWKEASPSVTAEGFAVTREGDAFLDHGCPKPHPPHSAKVTRGYATVTVNGRRIAHVGAPVDCDSKQVASGRPSVVVGGSG